MIAKAEKRTPLVSVEIYETDEKAWKYRVWLIDRRTGTGRAVQVTISSFKRALKAAEDELREMRAKEPGKSDA
jgi:hypothetical protein